MKLSMMKKLVLPLIALFFFSCSDNDELVPEPSKPEFPYTLKYTGETKIEDFTVYVGSPNGGVLRTDDFTPEEVFDIRTELQPDSFILSKDTISFSRIRYPYMLRHDSVFSNRTRYSSNWIGMGYFKNSQFVYHQAAMYIRRYDGHAFSLSMETTYKMLNYDFFFPEGKKPIEYNFSLDDLKSEYDVIAWCNVYHLYEKVD